MNTSTLEPGPNPATARPSTIFDQIEHGEVTVIDVRTTTEYRAGHIPRSLSIPMDEIEARIEDVPTEKPIVLVCQSGRRAEMTRALMAQKLHMPVCLEGGFDAWQKEVLPVVRSVRTRIALDRQSMVGASLLILASITLGSLVHPAWYFLGLLPGLGLLAAGTTGFCLMGTILSVMPWNKARN